MKTQNSYAWLSLIEVLIAILVFAVGILAVLQLVINTMTTVDKVSLQTQATMLSTQGMEMVHTIRNTNIMKWLPRDCAETATVQWGVLDTECPTKFADGSKVLRVSMQHNDLGDANPYLMVESADLWGDFLTRFNDFQLYAHTWTLQWSDTIVTWYDHDTSGLGTNFARYIEFFPVTSQIDGVGAGSEEYLLGVESTVLMLKGSYTWQIVMESVIGKIYN